MNGLEGNSASNEPAHQTVEKEGNCSVYHAALLLVCHAICYPDRRLPITHTYADCEIINDEAVEPRASFYGFSKRLAADNLSTHGLKCAEPNGPVAQAPEFIACYSSYDFDQPSELDLTQAAGGKYRQVQA
nr:hypothetical protein [Bradyrhizobium tropiciagri]